MEAKVGKKLTEMFTKYTKKYGVLKQEICWQIGHLKELNLEMKSYFAKQFSAVGLKGTGCFYERIIELLFKKKTLSY